MRKASRWSAIRCVGEASYKIAIDNDGPSHGSRDRQGAVFYSIFGKDAAAI